MVGEPPDEYDAEAEATEAVVRDHLDAIEHEVRGAGYIEGRRIVRRIKAWASRTEGKLIRGDDD